MSPIIKTTPSADAHSSFEKRFHVSFLRVYAYLSRRVKDHAAAERMTRDVLIRSLAQLLVDEDDDQLALLLLRNSIQALGAEERRHARVPEAEDVEGHAGATTQAACPSGGRSRR